MRLGLLGSDRGIADVAAAAVRRGDRFALACGVDEGVARACGATPTASWQPLLDAGVCDAVLVGADGWNAERAEAVRMLVQAGRPLVLAQPLELSMLWAYELDMIRRDTGSLLVPCLPDRLHPFIARLRATVVDAAAGVATVGTIEAMHLERRMPDRSQDRVLAALSRDADLVRAIAGDPARISTLGGAGDNAWATLAVGLTGPAHLPVRWQVAPGAEPGLAIRLQGSTGTLVVEAPDDSSRPWTWAWGDARDSLAFDRGAAVLGVLDARLSPSAGVPAPADAATWNDAARAIELAETVPRSLAKGRAIDLHREEFSEIGTFKGTMASLGCGLIMLALVVVVAATLVAGIAREFGWKAAGGVADAWPVLVLAVLGVFLVLQLIPLLVGDARGDDEADGPPADAPPRP
ncbi:MAG: hypothetical protein ACKOC8_08955 [Pirellulales bacterium]